MLARKLFTTELLPTLEASSATTLPTAEVAGTAPWNIRFQNVVRLVPVPSRLPLSTSSYSFSASAIVMVLRGALSQPMISAFNEVLDDRPRPWAKEFTALVP